MPSIAAQVTVAAVGQATKRLVLNITPKTMERLLELARRKEVKVGEIVRRAIAIYSYIAKVREQDPTAQVLLKRQSGEVTELILPSEEPALA
jgi:hypothetical protein